MNKIGVLPRLHRLAQRRPPPRTDRKTNTTSGTPPQGDTILFRVPEFCA